MSQRLYEMSLGPRICREAAVVLTAVLVVALTGCGLRGAEPGVLLTETAQETGSGSAEETESAAAELWVYVCGAVREPGVYGLPDGTRVKDAVEAAGGFAGDADPEAWNLAQKLTDGQQIRIPTLAEREAEAQASPGDGSGLVNLNTATQEELMTLPGIGETRAQAIIDYREREGPFSSIEDVMLVSGIKEAAFQKIRDRITV